MLIAKQNRMPKPKSKKAIERRIISMRRSGRGLQEISDELGVSRTKIHMVLALSGFRLVHRKPGNSRRDRRIIALRRKGFTYRQIADIMEISATTAYYVSTVLGHFPIHPWTSEETINKILVMHKGGASLREIARVVGRDFGTVGRIIRRQRKQGRR